MHITPEMTCVDATKLLYQVNIIATKKLRKKQAPYPQAHG
jgi:hypothetical protein